jgi:hypothetical protein
VSRTGGRDRESCALSVLLLGGGCLYIVLELELTVLFDVSASFINFVVENCFPSQQNFIP